jgi:hypothetical protein
VELASTLISTGWASGVNAYATVLVVGLLGRAGVGEVPDVLTSTPVLIVAGAMYAVEFVVDKVPYLDNAWDAIHTLVRPAVGSALGLEFGATDGLDGLEEALAGGATGSTALASHAVKAGLRLGINASPEPLSNVLASLTEDGLAVTVAYLAIEQPELAAAIALALLALGIGLVVLLWTRIRRALRRFEERSGRPPPRRGGT